MMHLGDLLKPTGIENTDGKSRLIVPVERHDFRLIVIEKNQLR